MLIYIISNEARVKMMLVETFSMVARETDGKKKNYYCVDEEIYMALNGDVGAIRWPAGQKDASLFEKIVDGSHTWTWSWIWSI
jgi:hypothetical protein